MKLFKNNSNQIFKSLKPRNKFNFFEKSINVNNLHFNHNYYNNNNMINRMQVRNYGMGMGFYSWQEDRPDLKPHASDPIIEKIKQYHKEHEKEDDEEGEDDTELRINLPNEGTPLELQLYMKDLAIAFPFKVIIRVSKHCKVTKAGRVFSFSSFILVGNKNGAAGFGYGRGKKKFNKNRFHISK